MNYIFKSDKMKQYLAKDRSRYLEHYGRSKLDGAPGPGSGRYPLGSGEDPNQHRGDFISRVRELKKSGMSEIGIAKAVGCKNTAELRAKYSIAVNDMKNTQRKAILAMLADGKTKADVAKAMDIPYNTVVSLINEKSIHNSSAARDTAEFLRQQIQEKGMVEVGKGVEAELGISETRMKQALKILEDEGYGVYPGGIKQVTNPGQQTPQKVLCAPGIEYKDIYDFNKVKTINDYTLREDGDGAEIFTKKFEYPESMDSSRLMIRYRNDVAPDGHTGVEKDGTIEIRPGCPDLDLGNSHYAQVRILVDGDKYLKGMAFYNDQMPEGIDVIFNTNKAPGKDPLKPIGSDPNNPFGALIREEGGQSYYTGADGKEHLGLINKTKLEGDWEDWTDKLPSQFLSKQPMELIRKQLNTSIADKQAEFDDIMALTNPTVKAHFLTEFASDCDGTAVDLHAASLPRQKYQVIMPLSTLSDTEVYAPGYRDGETVALVRFPHAGTFEIPILKVNNNQPEAKRLYGDNPQDLIAINSKVAERLSGADFDGDTAMVIPCNSPTSSVRILSTNPLKGLEGFDPKEKYGTEMRLDKNGNETYWRDGHQIKVLSKENTQREMGIVSNLITDMQLKGANDDELARAVAHSMTIIDANKHKLDWQASAVDNRIDALKREYQLHYDEDGEEKYGASTLLSRAKGDYSVPKRQGSPRINQEGKPWYDPNKPEGAEIYKLADDLTYVDRKTGKVITRTQKSTQMAEADDARKLSSGTQKEEMYAYYANWMKAKANEARIESIRAGKLKYDANAAKTYKDEVQSLMDQLRLAEANAPRERQAQRAANLEVEAMIKEHPDMTKKEKKKIAQQALARNRVRFGAHRFEIKISPRMWDAIQAGAISDTKLKKILRHSNAETLRSYATPRSYGKISPAKQSRIEALRASGYTYMQIADMVGLSKSTVSKYLNGGSTS